MRILVTGSEGQLGNAIKELSPDHSMWTWKFTDLPELDITDQKNVYQKVENFKPDWIINAAAYTDVDAAESNKDLVYQINAEGPLNLAIAAKKIDAKLIHISTDYVFDGTKDVPYTVDDKTSPLQVYGKSKLEGENKIQETDVLGIILRTSWLYGHPGKNFVKTILRLAEEKDEIQVVNDQIGSPTYANDLAEAIIKLLQIQSLSCMELLHFSNNGGISWYEFAKKIVLFSGLECIIKPISSEKLRQKSVRPSYSVLDLYNIKKKYNILMKNWDSSLSLFLKKIK